MLTLSTSAEQVFKKLKEIESLNILPCTSPLSYVTKISAWLYLQPDSVAKSNFFFFFPQMNCSKPIVYMKARWRKTKAGRHSPATVTRDSPGILSLNSLGLSNIQSGKCDLAVLIKRRRIPSGSSTCRVRAIIYTIKHLHEMKIPHYLD